MVEVVGVRFKHGGHIYYFSPNGNKYNYNEKVVVETKQCRQLADVAIEQKEIAPEDIVDELQPIIRKATADDLEKAEKNKKDASAAFGVAKEKIQAHQLDMKLIDVEYTFDRSKMIFYFAADGRIDFRELVKDLAAIFKTRIELRQIGVRDEAKELGGIGPCGRVLCCTTFLGDFMPVSIKMAKDQNLSLNPTKISGLCGRLMCCLKYENDLYQGCCKQNSIIAPPKQGSRVVSMEGEGKAISINMQKRTVTVLLDSKKTIVASWEDVVEKDDDDI